MSKVEGRSDENEGCSSYGARVQANVRDSGPKRNVMNTLIGVRMRYSIRRIRSVWKVAKLE